MIPRIGLGPHAAVADVDQMNDALTWFGLAAVGALALSELAMNFGVRQELRVERRNEAAKSPRAGGQ